MKALGKLIVAGAATFASLQFVRRGTPSPAATAGIDVLGVH
jgi:hypothetical protein